MWLLFDPEGLEGNQPSQDVGLAALKLGRPQAYWQVSTLTLPSAGAQAYPAPGAAVDAASAHFLLTGADAKPKLHRLQ